MVPELPEDAALSPEQPGGELLRLRRCVRLAFGLARSGAVARGYRLLCAGRIRAARTLPAGDPRSAELLCLWATAVGWFERHVPPALP